MKSRKLLVGPGLILAMGLALVGCGAGPGDTIKAWSSAMNEGKYSEVEQYLSKSVLTASKQVGDGAIKQMADGMTNNGTLSKVEIQSEEVNGDSATVKFTVHFKDGSTEPGEVTMVKEEGKWKVNF
jgi:hypothetical protein